VSGGGKMNEHENANEKRWISLYEVLKKQKYFDDPGNSDISEYIDMLTHSVPGYSVDEEGKYTKGIDLSPFHERLRSEENLKLVRKEGCRAKFCDDLKKVLLLLYDVRIFEGDLDVDYHHWADVDYWTANEAAWLLSSIDQETHGYLEYDEEVTLRQYRRLFTRARDTGAIKTVTKEGGLDPKSVLEWAEKGRIEVPYKLRKAIELKSTSWELGTDHVDKKEASPQSPPHGLSFFRNGEIWKIGEIGREMDFLHSDGLKYIHFLLQHEHKELNSLEVYHLGEVPPELKDEQKNTFQAKNDHISKTAYYKGLGLLEEKLSEEEDLEKQEDIQEKINHISKQLQEEGRGFQSSSVDKARQTVQKAIKSALEKIQKECPKAYEQLSDPNIKTGISCRYSPLKSIPWKLTP